MMKFVRTALFAVAAGCVFSAAHAAGSADPPSQLSSTVLAQELADLLDPVDLVVAMDRRFAVQKLESLPPSHPVAAIRQKNPKLFAVIEATWQDVVEGVIRSHYPDKRTRVVNLFASALSQSDLRALVDYYQSPLGKKVVAIGFAKMNVPATSAESDFQSAASAARLAMVGQLSPDETAAMAKFALTPVVARFEPVNHQRMAIGSEWASSLAPELQRVVAERIREAVQSYVAAHPGEPH